MSDYSTINNNFVKKQNINNTIRVSIQEEPKQNENKIKFVKHLFRKLSKIIHPDKKNKNSYLFVQSKNAYDNKCISELIYLSYISDLCNIDIPECLKSTIYNELKTIKHKINELKSTISWKWNTGNNTEKEQIINLIKDI